VVTRDSSGKLLGVVSLRDLLQARVRNLEAEQRRERILPVRLVVLGRNNPSLYTVNGRPLYVHLNGLAIVLLK
jgi:hypothetical protein